MFLQNFACSSSFLLSLPTLCGGAGGGGRLAYSREPRLAEVLDVSGGQVGGAVVAEQTPDPVLSINLNPDLPGP